jgi:hypothetical protein
MNKDLQRKASRSHDIIVAINKLIEFNAVHVIDPITIELMADLLPTDPKRRESYLKNLYTYARLKLQAEEGETVTILDMETSQEIAKICYGTVALNSAWLPPLD